MAYYRYILADLLTNVVIAELPFESVSFGSRLGKPGNFQASFGLGRGGYKDEDILNATEPGRTAIYIERTEDQFTPGFLVWGGIIWSRTWQEQSYSLQFTGQSFESFAYQSDLRMTRNYSSGFDQRNILLDLYLVMQSMTNRNIGITLPAVYGTTNYSRNPVYYDYEAWTFGKIIDNVLKYSNSFDYYIGVRYDLLQRPEKYLVVDDIIGNPIDQTGLIFDYPGSIRNYWWPENASRGAVSINGIGAGEGSTIVRVVVSDATKLAAGYPDIAQLYSNKDTTDLTTLINQSAGELSKTAIPITIPTIELNSQIDPKFGSYQLGDYARFVLESKRWSHLPLGQREFTQRIVGWDVKPSGSDGMEEVKLILAGQDG